MHTFNNYALIKFFSYIIYNIQKLVVHYHAKSTTIPNTILLQNCFIGNQTEINLFIPSFL